MIRIKTKHKLAAESHYQPCVKPLRYAILKNFEISTHPLHSATN